MSFLGWFRWSRRFLTRDAFTFHWCLFSFLFLHRFHQLCLVALAPNIINTTISQNLNVFFLSDNEALIISQRKQFWQVKERKRMKEIKILINFRLLKSNMLYRKITSLGILMLKRKKKKMFNDILFVINLGSND